MILGLRIAMVMVVLAGCGSANYATDEAASYAPAPDSSSMGVMAEMAEPLNSYRGKAVMAQAAGAPMAPQADQAVGGAAGAPAMLATMGASQTDRLVIKHGTVSLEVDDVLVAGDKVIDIAKQLGGDISNRNDKLPAVGQRTVSMQIRMPAEQFESALKQVDDLGEVITESVRTEEVTEEFLDTDSRVRNFQATEARILTHLERATQLEEILRVEQELTRVRGQIEQLQGRLRYLSDRIRFSTLDVMLTEEAKMQTLTPPDSFSVASAFGQAWRSLSGLLKMIAVVFVFVGVWGLLWVPLTVLVLYLARRLAWRALLKRWDGGPPVIPKPSE